MSRLLVELLGVREKDFRKYIDRLERICLNPSVDIRLSAEIITRTREKARLLQLDIQDTTHQELFYAMIAKMKQDDEQLREVLKLADVENHKVAVGIAKIATILSKKEKVLCMSSGAAKQVLNAVPPRKTLRLLKVRSLVSLLKREDPRVIYALACELEDESWKSQVHAKMKRLPSKDIGWHQLSAFSLSESVYAKVEGKLSKAKFLLENAETGIVVLLPLSVLNREGAVVLFLGLLLQALERLSIDNMPYRKHGFMLGYEAVLSKLAHGEHSELVSLHGLLPTWAHVRELLVRGHIDASQIGTEFVTADLAWQSVEMKIATILPAFDFWVDSHYLGVKTDERPVSLHMLDVASDLFFKKHFNERSVVYLEHALWNELQIRYLQQESLTKNLLRQFSETDQSMLL